MVALYFYAFDTNCWAGLCVCPGPGPGAVWGEIEIGTGSEVKSVGKLSLQMVPTNRGGYCRSNPGLDLETRSILKEIWAFKAGRWRLRGRYQFCQWRYFVGRR